MVLYESDARMEERMVVVSQRGIKIMTNITLSRDVQDRNSIFFLPMILSLRNKAFQGGGGGGGGLCRFVSHFLDRLSPVRLLIA